MRTSLYLKTRSEIINDCESRLSDTDNKLATAVEYGNAVNEGVRMWAGRVAIPRIHALSSGFAVGTSEYVLPNHIKPPIVIQIRSTAYNLIAGPPVEADNSYTWHELAGYTIEPVADGTFLLRLPLTPYTEEGRIIYWQENGFMPAGTPTLDANIDADDNEIAVDGLAAATELSDSGFLKVDSEWIAYSGITRGASGFTLHNCLRGFWSTVATTHVETTEFEWGIAVDDTRLWVQLMDYVAGYVHGLRVHKNTSEDVTRHEKLMSFYETRAQNFWRQQGYIRPQPYRMRASWSSIGPIAW